MFCKGSAFILTGDLSRLMYNASLYTKFFWVDDYYITGLLANATGVNFQFFNSLYIINHGLVEQRFKGKQADYVVFGHLPNSKNKFYEIWQRIYKTHVSHARNLPADVNQVYNLNVFQFKWTTDFWELYS
jgi:hypothetical protein